MVSVYAFKSYRDYLQAWYLAKKESGEFSYEKFSDLVGLKSRSFFKLVIDGKRDLTSELIFRTAKALGLDGDEHQYFEWLVQENQSAVPDQKRRYTGLLKKLKSENKLVKAKIEGEGLLESSIFLAALALLSESPEGITRDELLWKLRCRRDDLDSLLRRLLDRNALEQTENRLRLRSEFTIFNDKKDWARKQQQFLLRNLDRSLKATRMPGSRAKMHSMVFTGSWARVQEYQSRIQELLAGLAEEHYVVEPKNSELLQLNVQLFGFHDVQV